MMRKLVGLGVLASALTLAACSSTDQPEGDSSPAVEPSPGEVSTEGVRVAYASDLDPNDIADQVGLRESDADVSYLTEDSAVVAGLQNGDYDIGNIDITAAIKAIQAGVPLKIVYVAQDSPEFVMIAQPELSELSDLVGKTVAYHASGSLTEILQRELFRQNAPELEDEVGWTVLPESPNRAAAMLAGRVDATTLEYLDVLTLQDEKDFTILGDWSDLTGASGDAIATGWVVSEDYLADHRETVVTLLSHVQRGYDTVYSDPAAWESLATELLPDLDPDHLEMAYAYYTDAQMYPRSGTPPITQERWEGLNEFFTQIGEYEQEAPVDMVDLGVVEEVNAS